jgi:hypothetical protein
MASKRVQRQQQILRDGVGGAVRELQARAYQILTVETPVRTGFARAGWTPSIGAPDTTGPSRPASSPGAEGSASFNLVKAQAEALLALRSRKSEQIRSTYKLADGVVFISNNVNYMRYLNDGTSAQAPKQFVERGIKLAVTATRRALGL